MKTPLRIGTTMTIKRTNPVTDYYYSIVAMLMTHDSLVRFDGEMKPVPQLAERFYANDACDRWTFHLVSGAKWHDGRPVTPEDVAFTFDYIGKHHVSGSWITDLIERVDIRGREIVFQLKKPFSRFLINAGFVVRILPKHIWENIPDPFKTRDSRVTLGCGPYRFSGFEQSAQTLKFDVNPQYYGNIAQVDEVHFRTFGTMDVLALALLKGQADVFYQYASGLPVPYTERLKQDSQLALMESLSMGVPAVLGFNLSRPLVKPITVRKALSLAIDYAQINRSLMQGQGEIPSGGLVPPPFLYQVPLAPMKQDLKESRNLMAEAGFKDENGDARGSSLRLTHFEKVLRETMAPLKNESNVDLTPYPYMELTLLVRSDLWGESQLVKLLAGDFQKVGIRLNVRKGDLSTYLALLKQGDYDLVLFRMTPWGMMMHAGYGSGYFDAKATGHLNLCRLNDAKFSRLCREILRTRDAHMLQKCYADLQLYYQTQMPAVALCWGRNFFPHNDRWRGFQVNPLEGGIINRFTWKTLRRSSTAEAH